MPDSWATYGVDLHVELAGHRVRASLEDALREAVRSGRLPAGLRLPSSRSLAADLGVARNTVADAYGQLVAEGWLTARQGSATRVADRPTDWTADTTDRVADRRADWTADTASRAADRPGPGPPVSQPPPRLAYNLQPGSPDTAAFPRAAWLAATRRALAAAPHDALGYRDPQGRVELRTALAGYLARARGVRADPDRIVVCAGFAQAVSLISTALRARGAATMAMEANGLQGHRDLVSASGLAIDLMPVDEEGARTDDITQQDAVLVTPAHQFPMGVPLASGRRTRLVEWSRRGGALVIEDDYDGEFRYDRQPVGALQGLADDRVAYIGTASKALVPGLRLGWMVLPGWLVPDVFELKELHDHTSRVEQLALAELITSGQYDRHVRRARLAYRSRRDRLVEALARAAPWARLRGIAAGLHAVLELPAGLDETDVIAAGARRGLALEGLSTFSTPAGAQGPALVIGYGTPPQHAFTGALARLTAVLAELG
jgi:GntR family transcriptional regulator/MocR family aminotransferase